jgi:hypothetical protein
MKHIKSFENWNKLLVKESFLGTAAVAGGLIILTGLFSGKILKFLGKSLLNKLSKGVLNNTMDSLKKLDANYVVIKIVEDDIYIKCDTSYNDQSKPEFDFDNLRKYNFMLNNKNEFINPATGDIIGKLNPEDRELFLKVINDYEKGNFSKYESLNESLSGIVFWGTLLLVPAFIISMKKWMSNKINELNREVFEDLLKGKVKGKVKVIGEGESLHIQIEQYQELTEAKIKTDFYITEDNRVLVHSTSKFFKDRFSKKQFDFQLEKPGSIPEYTKEICQITDEEKKELIQIILNKSIFQ